MRTQLRIPFLVQAVLGALVIFLVGWLDHASGYQIDLTVFYFIPIALWTWNMGIGPGIIMALVATAGALSNDFLAGHVYAHFWLYPVNAVIHLAAFLIAMIGVHTLCVRMRREATLRRQLQELVRELEAATTDVRQLQTLSSLSFCRETHRIKVGQDWIDLRDFFRDKLHVLVKDTRSEEALEKLVDKFVDYHETHEAA